MERNNLMDLLFVFATITVDQKYISNTRVCNIIFLYIASTLSNQELFLLKTFPLGITDKDT
jgi:hypothetical protein